MSSCTGLLRSSRTCLNCPRSTIARRHLGVCNLKTTSVSLETASTQRGAFQIGGKANGFARHKAGLPNDRYLPGGVKDCHALHIYLALKRMSSFKLSRAFPKRTAHAKFAMFNLDYENFCWERSFRGIRPACQIGKLVFPLDETVAFAPIKVDFDYSAANSTGRRRVLPTAECTDA